MENTIALKKEVNSDSRIAPGPLVPPFTMETALQKVRAAEDGWNGKNPEKVSLAYSPDSVWRNRSEFLQGRDEIVAFLEKKWARELRYKLIKELWACSGNCIAVRFAYEWHDAAGQWYRSYGNENWQFNEQGLMTRRIASINDLAIAQSETLFLWEGDIRPAEYPGLSDSGL